MKRIAIYTLLTLAILAISMMPVAFAATPGYPDSHPYADYFTFITTGGAGQSAERIMLPVNDEGAIDLTEWPIPYEYIEDLMPGAVPVPYVEFGMYELDINCQGDYITGQDGKLCATADRAFRRAVSYLVDHDWIVTDVVTGGQGWPEYTWLDYPIHTSYYSYDVYDPVTDTSPIGYDWVHEYSKAKAIQTLKDAGILNTDGSWNTAYGQIKFYIRSDHAYRKMIGERVAADLADIGVDVDPILAPASICYQEVMVDYDYNIYTGGWGLTRDPDHFYDLFHSDMYWAPDPWSLNYPAFDNATFDMYAEQVKFARTYADLQVAAGACKMCQVIMGSECPSIPCYSNAGTKAYRSGWVGSVNEIGAGLAPIFWSAYNMHWEGTGTRGDIDNPLRIAQIIYPPEEINPFSAQWYWTWQVLGKIYDSLIMFDPYYVGYLQESGWMLTGSEGVGWVTENQTVGDPFYGATDYDYYTKITWNLRDDIKWHDGTGFTAYDVEFSHEYLKYWGSPIWAGALEHIYDTDVISDYQCVTYFDCPMQLFGSHTAGGIVMLPKHVWEGTAGFTPDVLSDDRTAWGTDPTTWYDPDYIGTGPLVWIDTAAEQYVAMRSNRAGAAHPTLEGVTLPGYFKGQSLSPESLISDVNFSGLVDMKDVFYVSSVFGREPGEPEWSPGCDVVYAWNVIDMADFLKVAITDFGKTG